LRGHPTGQKNHAQHSDASIHVHTISGDARIQFVF
jgi:hypothetical protein